MPFWYFLFSNLSIGGGWSELLVGVSIIPLLHLFSVLTKLSSTSSSSFAWVRSEIFRVLHQKYSCSLYKCRQGSIIISRYQFKKVGEASPILFVLNPKSWAKLHHHFSFSIQKKWARLLLFEPNRWARLHPKISCSNQNDRRDLIQKSPVQTKRIGKAPSKNLLFKPKE